MKKTLRLQHFTTTPTGYVLTLLRNGKAAQFDIQIRLDDESMTIRPLDREARRCDKAKVEFAVAHVNQRILADEASNEQVC